MRITGKRIGLWMALAMAGCSATSLDGDVDLAFVADLVRRDVPGSDGASPFDLPMPDLAMLDLAMLDVAMPDRTMPDLGPLGCASGTGFPGPPVLPIGWNPGSVALGDLNGDGKADLAVTDSVSNTVSALLARCL